MYKFRKLKSRYTILIRYQKPDHTYHEYKANVHVSAKKKKEDFLFKLEQRTHTKLNEQEPQNIVDQLMLALGNAIYPIELHVNSESKILSISNFDEIKEKYTVKSKELYEQNKTPAFLKYLKMSAMNLVNEAKFRESLLRDTFIQMYFLNYGAKTLEFSFVNFPEQSKVTAVYANHMRNSSRHYIIEPAYKMMDTLELKGKIEYFIGDAGELQEVTVALDLKNNKEEYFHKFIFIQADSEVHEAKTGLFF